MPILIVRSRGLHRAVLNVVTNAIDACEQERPGPRVASRPNMRARETLVRIIVEDNGAGIAAGGDGPASSPFFVSNKGGRGTGLGLPVSQKILREHGGDIRHQPARSGEAASPWSCPPWFANPPPTAIPWPDHSRNFGNEVYAATFSILPNRIREASCGSVRSLAGGRSTHHPALQREPSALSGRPHSMAAKESFRV